MGLASALHDTIFSQIHSRTLVYNTCWEDPRCDRILLQLTAQSRVAMLTSAGCNALDYLLDDCAEIHCVDLNPRQNAVLHLKIAFLEAGDHEALFEFFGRGASPRAREILNELVFPHLKDAFSRDYWQRNLHYFEGRGLRPSFYWHGSSGAVAWLVRQWLHAQPDALRLARRLFETETLDGQMACYEQFEPLFLNRFVRWLMRQHLIQSMLGVPKSQQHLAAGYFDEGMAGYLRHCLRQVFVTLPIQDNYFWKLYFFGQYSPDCCPNYLRQQHFEPLRERCGRIRAYTGSFSSFLRDNPGSYTHFVLLDHQDWLAAHLRPALDEEWQLIFDNAAPGAQVLLRSAAFEPYFLSDFVRERVRFDFSAAAEAHAVDRVGTYASTWIGTITG